MSYTEITLDDGNYLAVEGFADRIVISMSNGNMSCDCKAEMTLAHARQLSAALIQATSEMYDSKANP